MRGGQVIRCIGDDAEPRAFDVYCAVAFAHLKTLPPTQADRSITIRLKRKLASESCEEVDDRAEGEAAGLCRKITRWIGDNKARLHDQPKPPGMINREADKWRPLFAIAGAAGAGWVDRLAAAARAIVTAAGGDTESIKMTLLRDIRDAFDVNRADCLDPHKAGRCALLAACQGTARKANGGRAPDAAPCERFPTRRLLEVLHGLDESPWRAFGKAGKPLTEIALAGLLRPFGIRSTTIGTGVGAFKGYTRERFRDAWDRYLAHETRESLIAPQFPPVEPLRTAENRQKSDFQPVENPGAAEEFSTAQVLTNPASPAVSNGSTARNGDTIGKEAMDGGRAKVPWRRPVITELPLAEHDALMAAAERDARAIAGAGANGPDEVVM
jgi:hypothetical protein